MVFQLTLQLHSVDLTAEGVVGDEDQFHLTGGAVEVGEGKRGKVVDGGDFGEEGGVYAGAP